MNAPVSPTRLALGLALAAALLSAGCAVTPVTGNPSADATVLARADSLVRQSDPSRAVQASAEPSQVVLGGTITLRAASAAAGYAYVFKVSSDGKAFSLLFPNAQDGANYVAAGSVLQLPRPGWQMAARGPAGLGYLVTVVAEQQQDLRALDAALAEQRMPITGRYGAAMTPVREVQP